MYRTYLVSFVRYDASIDLIILGIVNFDIFFVMDWLALHHSILDFYAKTTNIPRINDIFNASFFSLVCPKAFVY